MKQTISFPGLGIESMTLNSTAFSIFGIEIAWYALIITFGMILAIAYTIWRASEIGINYEQIIDFAIFVVPFGILGARLYYVLCALDQYDSFWDIFNIREGGLAIYGGIIAGAVTVYVVCKVKKIYFPALGDCIVPGLILAQSIGRWGNFVNVEAFGSATTLPWRMSGYPIARYMRGVEGLDLFNPEHYSRYSAYINGELGVHPTFFYESMWNLIGFITINFFYKHKKYDGEIILLVFGWYGLGRLWIEGLRTDSLYIPGTGIRVSQLLAILIFLGCLGLLIYFFIKPPKRELYKREEPAVAEGAAAPKSAAKASAVKGNAKNTAASKASAVKGNAKNGTVNKVTAKKPATPKPEKKVTKEEKPKEAASAEAPKENEENK